MSTNSIATKINKWTEGVPHEMEFWEHWLATRGAQWPDAFQFRLNPDAPLQPVVDELIPTNKPIKILDVGAGPLTRLGKKRGDAALAITACDPLAPLYSELLSRFKIDPIVRTEQAFAEDLSLFYDANAFEIVYCCNALDHSYDPLRGIEEMLLVTAPGGHVVLEHHCNEGEKAGYHGLHQWNFDLRAGRFVIWNHEKTSFVDECITSASIVKTEMHVEERRFTVVIRKSAPTTVEHLYARTRDRFKDFAYRK
jgi:SAM-dependent methyltransferase